jgi:F420-dependent oxidoreductase-like protein
MKVGLQIPRFKWPGGAAELGPRLREIARTAEDAGFASLWVMDHLWQIPVFGEKQDPMLECYAALNHLAAVTERVQLGGMVTGVVYRHPGMLVKSVTTLDVLSGGRAYCSIGAAWYEEEARGLGIPWPERGARFAMVEETLRIAKQMWSGSDAPFSGTHYQLAETLCRPLPLSQPHPPILIGGNGEGRTLRLVARYGDACNLLALQPDGVRQKLDVLRRHCEREGRDFDTIERTSLNAVPGATGGSSPAELVPWLRDMAAAGIQHAIISLPDVQDLTPLRVIGTGVIPAVVED